MVNDYINDFEGSKRQVLDYFHSLLTTEFNLEAMLKYKIPFYYCKSWICYLNPGNDHIEVAFPRGNELSNEQGLLNSKGRKQVMGVEFKTLDEIPRKIVSEIIHEAVLLDETTPYKSKRNK